MGKKALPKCSGEIKRSDVEGLGVKQNSNSSVDRSWVVCVRTQAGGELELEAVERGAELDREPRRQGATSSGCELDSDERRRARSPPSIEEPGNF
jgi:hypothetical protein